MRKFFKIRASTGDVVYYDKSQGQEVTVSLPFQFIVLDVLNTVGGFHEPTNSGIWSNEVRNSNKDVLRVRNKAGLLAEGPYSEIKDRLKALGGKFANSVYVAYREGGEWTLGNITFIGASVSEWFDFTKGKRLDSDPGVVIAAGWEARKKGRTEFYVPKFDSWTVPANDLGAASALDRDLQAYLNSSGSADTAGDTEPAQESGAPAQSYATPAQGLQPEPPF